MQFVNQLSVLVQSLVAGHLHIEIHLASSQDHSDLFSQGDSVASADDHNVLKALVDQALGNVRVDFDVALGADSDLVGRDDLAALSHSLVRHGGVGVELGSLVEGSLSESLVGVEELTRLVGVGVALLHHC